MFASLSGIHTGLKARALSPLERLALHSWMDTSQSYLILDSSAMTVKLLLSECIWNAVSIDGTSATWHESRRIERWKLRVSLGNLSQYMIQSLNKMNWDGGR